MIRKITVRSRGTRLHGMVKGQSRNGQRVVTEWSLGGYGANERPAGAPKAIGGYKGISASEEISKYPQMTRGISTAGGYTSISASDDDSEPMLLDTQAN